MSASPPYLWSCAPPLRSGARSSGLPPEHARAAGVISGRVQARRQRDALERRRVLLPAQRAVVLLDLDDVGPVQGDMALRGPGPIRLVRGGGEPGRPVVQPVERVAQAGAGDVVAQGSNAVSHQQGGEEEG